MTSCAADLEEVGEASESDNDECNWGECGDTWLDSSAESEPGRLVCEALRGCRVSVGVRWPECWNALIAAVRGLPFPGFWEIFCGVAVMTNAFHDAGWPCAPPVDIMCNSRFNVLEPLFLYIVVSLLLEGRIRVLWLGPPCSSFSMALNRFPTKAIRSWAYPEGFPWLCPKSLEKVRYGNALRDAACCMAEAQHKAKNLYALEQPKTSLMLPCTRVVDMIKATDAVTACRSPCLDGAPWEKPTAIVSNFVGILDANGGCPGGHKHIVLSGKAPDGRSWTAVASPYWPAFASVIAQVFTPLLALTNSCARAAAHTAGFLLDQKDPLEKLMQDAGFAPSAGRSARGVASTVSAGVQPTRRALPQMVPDFLQPDTHVQVALSLQHPFQLPVSTFPPIAYALGNQLVDPGDMAVRRSVAVSVVRQLAKALEVERDFIIDLVHPQVRAVLTSGGLTKHIPLMRELAYVTGAPDWGVCAAMLVGQPMLGWTAPVPAMVPRYKPPDMSILEFRKVAGDRSTRILSGICSSGDTELDRQAVTKSREEFERGVLEGPWKSVDELPDSVHGQPIDNKCVRIHAWCLWRHFPWLCAFERACPWAAVSKATTVE